MARMRWRVRLRSWFDATMDRGTPALVAWLGLASALLIAVVTALALLLTPVEDEVEGGWPSVVWMSLLRTLDPGTMGGDSYDAVLLGLMLAVTIGGIFIVSALIGVLTTGLEARISELRKGRSPVIARRHTVLLGWSDQVFTIVAELVKANQANRPARVVILADQDKIDMQDQIRTRVGDTGRLRVTCRSGSPLKGIDLELVSLDTARWVIVLSPSTEHADIDVIKALLLLRHRRWPDPRPHVVAAIQESRNMPAARLAAGPHGELVDADDITVRLVVQSHRQTGLSTVYTDLLDFAGNEIYLRAEPRLTGRSCGDALHAYRLGCPIGIRRPDGTVALNPPSDTPIAGTDQIIVLAEDDTLIRLTTTPPTIMAEAIATVAHREPVQDRTLLIGWNSRDRRSSTCSTNSRHADRWPRSPHRCRPPACYRVGAATSPSPPAVRADQPTVAGQSRLGRLSAPGRARRRPPGPGPGRRPYLGHSAAPARHRDRLRRPVRDRHRGQRRRQPGDRSDHQGRRLHRQQQTDQPAAHPVGREPPHTAHPGRAVRPGRRGDPASPGHRVRCCRDAGHVRTVVESARRRGETAIGYRLQHRSDQPPSYGVVINPPKTHLVSFDAADSVILVGDDAPPAPIQAPADAATAP
jgi:ion channel POLLUX/CASTOR